MSVSGLMVSTAILSAIVALILYKIFKIKRPRKSLYGKHVVITGGSSGIGRAVAERVAQDGAHVTIIARNVQKLNQALETIKLKTIEPKKQIITTASVDVSDHQAVEAKIQELEENIAPIYMLVNCAGLAIGGLLEEFTQAQVKQMIDVNFLGTFYPIQSVLPRMKWRKEGLIVITGSQLSLLGMFGMSVYSATKFALRGLAESLFQEAKEYGVKVCLCLPADTDTPGLQEEMKTKPLETKLLSDAGGLHLPEVVANQLLNDALEGNFFSFVGFESWILTTLCVGMSPFNNILSIVIESLILGFLRFVSTFYIRDFHKIIKKCHQRRINAEVDKHNKEEEEKNK